MTDPTAESDGHDHGLATAALATPATGRSEAERPMESRRLEVLGIILTYAAFGPLSAESPANADACAGEIISVLSRGRS